MNVKLVVTQGAPGKQTIPLRSVDTIIGRRRGCDLRIPSSSVSRRHCRLIYRDDLLNVEDLASANGTFVNGVRVKNTQVLRPGDKLQVGSILFVVQYQLSPQAIQRLMELGEAPEIIDVEPVESEEVLEPVALASDDELDEAIPLSEDAPVTLEVVLDEAPAEAKGQESQQKKSGAGHDDQNPDASIVLAKPWNAPTGEDLRDILTKLEKED